jgi:CheY-specific phosphatase CheX
MPPSKLIDAVEQAMQSAIARARGHLESEYGISATEAGTGGGDPDSLTLPGMTAIVGMGGSADLLIAFSFQAELIDVLYRRMTHDLDVQPDEVQRYREAAAGDVANTILGHCTVDLQKPDRPPILITPPVMLGQAKTIRRMKDAVFCTQALDTVFGRMNISLAGPRELFDAKLDYAR